MAETLSERVDDFGRCVWCGQMATTGGCANYECKRRRELPDTPVTPMQTTTITRYPIPPHAGEETKG